VDPYEGFEEFVTARTPALSRVAYLLTGDHHLAQDLLQVALTRVAARWPDLRLEHPEAYVRRCLVNEFTSWRRRRRYYERPTESLPDARTREDLEGAAIRRVVVGHALARLTPRQRAVLVLRYFEDLSEAETAEAMGIAIGTVKSQTNYAVGRLRVVAPELADLLANPNGRTR
jgi:RNA polymerase sigma-70 factor (sigma-E family)